MAPRSSWKGFIKLSLVSVPVKAFTAHDTGEDIRLNQLHKDCNQRVRYKKICPEHGELTSDEIVSGYEYTKDHYVVIDPDELDKLRTESDKSIGIEGFMAAGEVDSVYCGGRSYYLLPDGVAGKRPYALLAKGMSDEGVHAIARIVIARREQLVRLRPVDGLLVMDMLTYEKRVKSMDDFRENLEPQELAKEELKLTETLISASTLEDFDLGAYKDAYAEKLTKLIELKLDGKEVVEAPEPEEPKIINLMEALKQSVAEAQAGKRKMAPSAKSGATTKQKGKKKKTG